ncbi:hypothetical protein NHH73_04750 [Oxalobacteraceae bacterium OTU3CINTB1]|nr:hypothetical protein NHH73_04750 [Oxalobacteraceae bacterium OTU3CINTB1]
MKTVQELRALRRIAEAYQRRGYTVVFEPPAESLPSFLGNYQPEILATKGSENMLIDVKTEGVRDVAAFMRLWEEVERHPGWQMSCATVPNVDPEVNTSGEFGDLDVDGLLQHLREIDLLARESQATPGMLTRLWIVYIAALRLFAIQEGFDRDGDTDLYRLDRAASNGLISNAEFEEARALLALRNRIVDGSDAAVAPEDYSQLRRMIQRAIDQIAPVGASEAVQHAEA